MLLYLLPTNARTAELKNTQAVFVDELGADPSCLSNATPKDDFAGGHADPNLTYAKDLVKAMGLTNKGLPLPEMEGKKVRRVSRLTACVGRYSVQYRRGGGGGAAW